MSCILCENCPMQLFEVKTFAQDDILEIIGARNACCLDDTRLICKPCQKFLEKLAQLKRRLRYLILRRPEERKPVNMKPICKLFASFQLDHEGGEIRSIPTPNPSSMYSVSDYEEFSEHNPEVISETRRRRRRRIGHGWTRRKRHYSSSSVRSRASTRGSSRGSARSPATPFSTLSGFTGYSSTRANTPFSDISYSSSYSRKSRRLTAAEKARNEENEKKDIMAEYGDTNKFYCPEKKCSLYYLKEELMKYHIENHHPKIPWLFRCTECDAKFSLEAHLRSHSKIHDFAPFFCLMCAEPQENRIQLQMHLEQHMIFSAQCLYCDKSFLTEELLDTHCRMEHYKMRKNKLIPQKITILKKIVFKKSRSNPVSNIDIPIHQNIVGGNEIGNPEVSNRRNEQESANNCKLEKFFKKNYTVHLTPQRPVDLDISQENFYFNNIDFFTGEGYEATESETQKHNKQNNVMETNNASEQSDRNCSSEEETDTSIVEENIDEEMGANNSSNPLEVQGTSCDMSANTTSQSLMNGLSDDISLENMDVVTDGDDHISHENPSLIS